MNIGSLLSLKTRIQRPVPSSGSRREKICQVILADVKTPGDLSTISVEMLRDADVSDMLVLTSDLQQKKLGPSDPTHQSTCRFEPPPIPAALSPGAVALTTASNEFSGARRRSLQCCEKDPFYKMHSVMKKSSILQQAGAVVSWPLRRVAHTASLWFQSKRHPFELNY